MTQEGHAEVAALEWVRRSVVGPAACITLVHSGGTLSVGRRFGGRPERARRLTLSAAQDEFGDDPWVGVRTVGPWILAVEVNGWQGSRPEVLDRLSSGTRVVSVYWSVNGQAQFSHAADGRVLTAFNGTTPERRTGGDPDALESMRAGLPWEDAGADPVLLMLALAARVTGLRVEPDWFDGEFQVVPVEPVAESVRAAVYPDTEPLTYHDPLLAWALRHAAEEQVRDAAWIAARYAAGLADLQTHPDVALALRDGGPAASAGLAKLAATMQRAARRSAGDTRPGGRIWAVTTLREAANPLPLAAGFHAAEAAWLAASAFGKPARELRESVLAVLGHPEPPSGSLGLTARPGVLPTDRYLWTAEHWLAPVGCLTYVKGLTPAAVVEAFGGDPDDAVTGRPALTADPVAAIRKESGWAVVVEHDERAGLPGLRSSPAGPAASSRPAASGSRDPRRASARRGLGQVASDRL